jgi:MerR family transcriptional regulator, copper efflux regulator
MGFSLEFFSAERSVVPPTAHTVREPGWSPHVLGAVFDGKLLESVFMRITEAARRLGTSARMLRYREDLGLLPQVRDRPGRGPSHRQFSSEELGLLPQVRDRPGRGPSHRQFSSEDLDTVAAALDLERRYDISPASLAFGVRVLAEPAVRASVADLGRRLGRVPAPASRALDFEKERALRLLSRG